MIMQRMNVAFLPGVGSFANAGERLNGYVINDRASLGFALDLLDKEIQQVPQDYIDCPDFGEHKPCLYVITKNVGFRQRNTEWINDNLKGGGMEGEPLVMPRHPIASGRRNPPDGSPIPHINPGASCYWEVSFRQDLRLAPFVYQ